MVFHSFVIWVSQQHFYIDTTRDHEQFQYGKLICPQSYYQIPHPFIRDHTIIYHKGPAFRIKHLYCIQISSYLYKYKPNAFDTICLLIWPIRHSEYSDLGPFLFVWAHSRYIINECYDNNDDDDDSMNIVMHRTSYMHTYFTISNLHAELP